MKLVIGNDHAAIEMKNEIKEYLEGKGIEVIDVGTNSPERASIIRFPAIVPERWSLPVKWMEASPSVVPV